MRLPARLLDPETAQRYCAGDAVSAWNTGENVVVAAVSEDEEGDFDWGGEGVLASILPVRAELLAGDLRAAYLSRLEALRREHGRKVTFVERLAHAGL